MRNPCLIASTIVAMALQALPASAELRYLDWCGPKLQACDALIAPAPDQASANAQF